MSRMSVGNSCFSFIALNLNQVFFSNLVAYHLLKKALSQPFLPRVITLDKTCFLRLLEMKKNKEKGSDV